MFMNFLLFKFDVGEYGMESDSLVTPSGISCEYFPSILLFQVARKDIDKLASVGKGGIRDPQLALNISQQLSEPNRSWAA